ncbi:MAG: hypothetical protein QM570_15515 [Planctomycetota bacterium]|nr:hypothetical protein [Planctomycetota bacterium]
MRMLLLSTLLAGAIFANIGTVQASDNGLRAEEVKRVQREPVDANALYGNPREKLEVVCTSAMVSSEVTNAGHKLARDRNRLERKLTFSLDLKILDSSNLVGLDVNHPVILTTVDGDGTDIRWLPRSYPVREYRAAKGFGGRGSVQLPRAVVQLILAPNQAIPASVAELTGYFHALYAEKVIEVDIPFDPNHPWIDAAPDLRIAVTVDTHPRPGPIEYRTFIPAGSSHRLAVPTAPVGLYQYYTLVQSTTEQAVLGLEDRWIMAVSWSLGDYVVIGTNLYDSQSDRLAIPDEHVMSDPFGKRGAVCWGREEQDRNDYDTIRHLIAVHPVEMKIPFVLTDIPVPGFLPTEAN